MSLDVVRSIGRYVAVALGDEWEVRTGPVLEAQRPFARVVAASPTRYTPRGATAVECSRGIAITAHPVDFDPTADIAERETARVERLLRDAFLVGLDPVGFSTHSDRGHPLRVALFRFEGLALNAPATDRLGWIRLTEPPAIGSFPDPSLPAGSVITCDLRVGWSEVTARAVSRPLVGSVTGRAVPS